MFEKIISFIVHQRLLMLILTGVLAVAGSLAWLRLSIDALPDVTNVQVMLLTEAPGLAPVDVEQRITSPIELAMQGLPRVREVRSLSKAGLSQVIVIFEDGMDTWFTRQLVFERIQSVKDRLPSWAEPEMGPVSTGLGEIYQYTLESATRTPMELRTLQDWLIAPQLRTIAGVNEVNSFGGFVKQYHVLVHPAALQKYALTLTQVIEALELNNANAGGGFIERGWEQFYVRTEGTIGSISDIENIVLKSSDGTPVRICDVATVQVGPMTRQGGVTRDGKGETVAGMVIMLRDENSKLVVDRVKKAIPRIQASLPTDVKISPFYDRTTLIQGCVNTVSSALLQGGIFVVLVLFVLLGNIRASLIVAISLPLTACIAFLLMGWQGMTANLMSLGGLAIALGMVVDASIVVTENIMRHLAERETKGENRLHVIIDSVCEVGKPIIFAILIIIVVFFPLFTLEQMEGKMFKPLALTICFAMAGSLVVAILVVPPLCSYLLRGKDIQQDNRLIRFLKQLYTTILRGVLRFRWLTVLTALILFSCTMLLVPKLGMEFLPALDEGAIAINVVRLPSASLDGSVAAGTFIEQLLLAFPEVESVVAKTGRAEISEDPMGPEQNDFVIGLKPKSQWTPGRTKEELVEAMQQELLKVPGIRPSFSQPIALRVNELISGLKGDLSVKLFGSDLEVLLEHGSRMASILSGIEGAEDVKVEQISGFPQIEIVPDRPTLARYGINIADVNRMIEAALAGTTATTVLEGQMRFAVLVRFPLDKRGDLNAIRNLMIPTPQGSLVPLSRLSVIREVEAPAQISHENGQRRVVVECNIRGRDMGGFVTEAQKQLAELEQQLPEGYYLRYGGQFENQERAMKRFSWVIPLSIALIFVMLFTALGTIRSALVVLMNLPFALIGGILIIWLLKINLSVAAVIGFIALFGTAVQDGIVMVSFLNDLVAKGMTPVEAVLKACPMRLVSILMTSLTTLLGLLPMLYATGSGAELQRPLAAVVLGGLSSALVLTFLVLPVLYVMVEEKFVKR